MHWTNTSQGSSYCLRVSQNLNDHDTLRFRRTLCRTTSARWRVILLPVLIIIRMARWVAIKTLALLNIKIKIGNDPSPLCRFFENWTCYENRHNFNGDFNGDLVISINGDFNGDFPHSRTPSFEVAYVDMINCWCFTSSSQTDSVACIMSFGGFRCKKANSNILISAVLTAWCLLYLQLYVVAFESMTQVK